MGIYGLLLACAAAGSQATAPPASDLTEGTQVDYEGRPGVIERQHHTGKYKVRFTDGQLPKKQEQVDISELVLGLPESSDEEANPATASVEAARETSVDPRVPKVETQPYGVVSDEQMAVVEEREAAAASRLVRRSVAPDGADVGASEQASNPFADPATHKPPEGDDAVLCARLAESELGVKWAKKLGGAGSGGVVFATTDGTVVKCGKGDNMKKEGDVLSHFKGVDGVVQVYQMTGPVEGMFLVHMELLNALEWKMCFLESACDCEGAGCFPSCRKRHGHGDKMYSSPLTYTQVRDMIKGHVSANLGVCQAGWSQMDASSGMNGMVTDTKSVKLIDFEQGQPLGGWGNKPWCNHDQSFMPTRIEEAVKCLPADDAFRQAATTAGGMLASMEAAGYNKCEQEQPGQCHNQAVRESTGALQFDIADSTEKVAAVLAYLDAMPIPASPGAMSHDQV